MEMVNESSGKHQKPVECGIGHFPDSILCKILYHLHTKDAVATSVLAKRWRFLWSHVQYLEFDRADFGPDSVGSRISFSEIVNRVLLLHNARCLEGISLRCPRGFNEVQFDSWIRAVIARNIEAIDLCFTDRFRLPDCLFNCKTLVNLMLKKCFCHVPRPACLPSLKWIRFEDVEFENDETLPNLISSCLLLTDLDIDGYGGMLRCNISSPSLRHIDLRDRPKNLRTSFLERKLVLDTPALRCLNIKDGLSQHISAGTLCLVFKADVDLQNYELKEDITYAHAVFAFVERLFNVNSLKLSSNTVMKFLDTTLLSRTSRFGYLTKLDLKADWRLLTKLLQCADKLEVLTIREVDFKLQCWKAPEHIPVCLLSSIQTVSFFGFGGGDPESDMLRYILRHAKVLKIMKLYSRYHGTDIDSKFKVLQQISRFPRGSDACEIDFY